MLYSALYRNRKVKPFSDGFVRVSVDGSKALLLDDQKRQIASLFTKEINEDDELEFDRFFCVVGAKELVSNDDLLSATTTTTTTITQPKPPLRPRQSIIISKFRPLTRKDTPAAPTPVMQQQSMQPKPKENTEQRVQVNDSQLEADQPFVAPQKKTRKMNPFSQWDAEDPNEDDDDSPFAIISPAVDLEPNEFEGRSSMVENFEDIAHKEGTPTFTERAGNFLLTFESKPQHIEVSKDDIWIISPTKDFSQITFIATGVFYGVSGANTVEISPFSDLDAQTSRTLDVRKPVFVIHGLNAMTDLLMMRNLENISWSSFDVNIEDEMEDVCGNVQPLMPELLGSPPSSHVTTANAEAEDDEIENVMGLVESVKKEFTLNQDQGSVIETIAMSVLKGQNGFQLVHGVFGSGKTYLIAVLVIFFHRAIEEGYFGHVPNFRIGISSMSN
ncbi:hypothetical protein HDU79_008598, partial [Rhizoclosmatium sp. JEL0117]